MKFKADEVFVSPMPHGFTWGLVLLKDLPKPPTPVRIITPKSKWKNQRYLRQRSK